MTVMHEVEFEYEVGEEVVFDLPPHQTGPEWTIGEIVERVVSEGQPRYVVRFVEGDGMRSVVVDERAIEGIA